MRSRFYRSGAFTLLELVISIGIGAILTVAVSMMLGNALRSSKVVDAKNRVVTDSYTVLLGLEVVYRASLQGIAGFVMPNDFSLMLFRDSGTPATPSKYLLETRCQPIPTTSPRYLGIAGRTFPKPPDCTLACPAGEQYVTVERRWPKWAADTDPSQDRTLPTGNQADDPIGMAVCFNSAPFLNDMLSGRLTGYYLSASNDIVSVEKSFFLVRNQTLANIEVIP